MSELGLTPFRFCVIGGCDRVAQLCEGSPCMILVGNGEHQMSYADYETQARALRTGECTRAEVDGKPGTMRLNKDSRVVSFEARVDTRT